MRASRSVRPGCWRGRSKSTSGRRSECSRRAVRPRRRFASCSDRPTGPQALLPTGSRGQLTPFRRPARLARRVSSRGAPPRVPTGPRRDPRRRHRRRAAQPRHRHRRRGARRRHVLRAQRLPDHDAAPPGMGRRRSRLAQELLRAPRPAAPTGARRLRGGRAGDGRIRSGLGAAGAPCARRGPDRGVRHGLLRLELPQGRGPRPRPVHAHVVARRGGAVLRAVADRARALPPSRREPAGALPGPARRRRRARRVPGLRWRRSAARTSGSGRARTCARIRS